MRVERPLAHGDVLNGLWRAARDGRLPHAIAFEGPSGTGKFVAAKRFALGLLCEAGPGEPCEVCGPCKRVLSGDWRGNHPDLHLIDPLEEGTERIKVERIAVREGDAECAESFLSLRPMEGGWRAVLVREAHRMNPAAQNALLKTLEEPTPGTLIVLETHRPELLLETIRSRCVRVRLRRLSLDEAAGVLAKAGIEAEDARRLARVSRGSPGDALDLRARVGLELRELAADVFYGRRPPLDAARAVFELEGDFRGTTPLARERDRARALLEIALALVGDAVRAGAGVPPDELAHGEVVCTGLSPPRAALDKLLEARADVERNLGPAPVIERTLLVLAEAGPVPSAAGG